MECKLHIQAYMKYNNTVHMKYEWSVPMETRIRTEIKIK